jgi:hypothetical protein
VPPSIKRLQDDLIRRLQIEESARPELHPYTWLRDLMANRDEPLALRILAATAILRVRLPALSASKQLIDVHDDRQQNQAPGKLDILNALLAATPEERAAILGSKKPLQLEGDSHDT